MTPAQFIAKWSDSTLRERQGSQTHFNDLCALLDVPTPVEDDPHGERYCFERGAEKVGGGDGWADVWKRGAFGWEYKGKHKDLDAALRQLTIYAAALENPPLLVVSDMERIRVHTRFTNAVATAETWTLDDLLEPAKRDRLRAVWTDPERFRPSVNRQDLTAKAAATFGELGRRLQERKDASGAPLHDPRAIAHFLNQLVFCMFAEDAGLLPARLFSRTLKATETRPLAARAQLAELFRKMAVEDEADRFFGPDLIRWFNGGLFDGAASLALEVGDLRLVVKTAEEHDWSQIDPAIFGTLFEQALKATRERPALGAHYTDREKILKIVDPVIVRPLTAEWEATRAEIVAAAAEADAAEARRKAVHEQGARALLIGEAKAGETQRRKAVSAALRERDAAHARARERLEAFLTRLAAFRVLDPACGSGNFLYVALHALRDLELMALVDFERLTRLQPPAPRLGLEVVRGIEIDRYAAELARVTLWIGDIQWLLANGFSGVREPVLSRLDQIENRDALLNEDGSEAEWPAADVIIGNPPFVGGKRLRENLGDVTVGRLFAAYVGRVPAEADLVTYWVEKAWRALGDGRAQRAGLVTTNSIRGGANRRLLAPIAGAGALMDAWADEPWVLEGAAVRVSLLSFGSGFEKRRLDGRPAERINADLSGGAVDLTRAARLKENAGVAFMGDTKGGPFDIPGDLAREWLSMPLNPNGRPNSDVLKPWRNAMDVTRRPADKWIIDFGSTMSKADAALYEAPFRHVLMFVKPERDKNKREAYRLNWWRHVEPRPGMWRSINDLGRFISTPTVAKHRLLAWQEHWTCPDHQLIAIARDDDLTFGILHSRLHELWALRMGTWLGVGNDPRYTPSTTFETFPFPGRLTPNIPAAAHADDPRAHEIAEAAAELNRLREAWLNPPDLVRIEPEVVPGYPDRILPRDEDAAAELKKRTLTNLYNQRPAWLDMAHRRLNAAVAAAYGWTDWADDLPDEEILARLFGLNQQRAAAGR